MDIISLINIISKTADCTVSPPMKLPNVGGDETMPDDMRHFYTLCGGITLYGSSPYSIEIVSPEYVALANPIIVGELCEYDISSHWYIFASISQGDYLTIDLSRERNGRCYDSFWDRHGVAGSCPIIASSFTEALQNMLANRGQYWYWLQSSFNSLGDAYD